MNEHDGSYVRGPDGTPLCSRTIGAVFDDTVSRRSSALALVSRHQNSRLSYAELASEVDAIAAGMRRLGITRGDRVGLWSPNCYEWVVVQLATARLGVILVTINPAYRVLELQHALNLTGCKALVLAERFKTSDYIAMVLELMPELSRSEPGELDAERVPTLRWVITLGSGSQKGMLRFVELATLGRSSSPSSGSAASLTRSGPLRDTVRPGSGAMVSDTLVSARSATVAASGRTRVKPGWAAAGAESAAQSGMAARRSALVTGAGWPARPAPSARPC